MLDKPWMTDNEIKCIDDFLRARVDPIMFEWGSGGSTMHFSKHCMLYRSVEYDPKWYNELKHNLPKNVDYHLGEWAHPIPEGWGPHNFKDRDHPDWPDIDTVDGQMEIFGKFICKIEEFNDKYDAILIDGRARIVCAAYAFRHMKDDGLVFIHDCKSIYILNAIEQFQQWYEVVDQVDELLVMEKLQ